MERVAELVGATLGRQAALVASRVAALEGDLQQEEQAVQVAMAGMGEAAHTAKEAARSWEQGAEKAAHSNLQALTQGRQAMQETGQEW
jgi:methyl-accepting chemotaxis protein